MRKLSRHEWIAGSFDALCDGGIDALRVEPLAKRLGVTKGSFYHHFENRRALHLAMLAEWERLGTLAIIDQVAGAEVGAEKRLRALAHRTMEIDPISDAIENSIRAWAATDEVVAEAASRVDDQRIAYVVGLLREIGLSPALAKRRARLLYRVLIGEFMWRNAGGPATTAKEIDEVVDLLLKPA